jgi:TPR repeat protein
MGCGANLQSGQAPTLQTTTQSAGKKKLLIGIGAGVGVLALAAVGIFVIYPKLSGDGTNQESSETVPGQSNEQKAKVDPPLPDDIRSLKAFLEPGANQLSAAHKTKAQYKLGKLLLEKGHEAGSDDLEDKVKADALYPEAVKYLTAAAEGGDAGAQYELGNHFSSEKDLIVNGRKVGQISRYSGKVYDTRHKWYIMAAEQGHSSAAFSLAYNYIKGKTSTTSLEERLSEAIKWLTVAAENGGGGSAYLIGECYYLSRLRESAFISDFELHKIIHAKREPKKACVWFSIASRRKFNIGLDEDFHKYAAEDIESLLKEGLLTQQQIDEADALAEKMIKDNPKLIERYSGE